MVRPAAMGAVTNVHAEARGATLLRMVVWSAVAATCVAIGCASDAGARRGAAPARHVQQGRASYYGRGFAGRKTASGERFDPNAMTAASPALPFGTRVRVSRADGRSVTVRINDRCGCPGGRIVDLSEGAARKLGMLKEGVVTVRMEVLGR
jgi:rare lipoprotein A